MKEWGKSEALVNDYYSRFGFAIGAESSFGSNIKEVYDSRRTHDTKDNTQNRLGDGWVRHMFPLFRTCLAASSSPSYQDFNK